MLSPDIIIPHEQIICGKVIKDNGHVYLIDEIDNDGLVKLLKIVDPYQRICHVEYAQKNGMGMGLVDIEQPFEHLSRHGKWAIGADYAQGRLASIIRWEENLLFGFEDDASHKARVYALDQERNDLHLLTPRNPFYVSPNPDPTADNLSYYIKSNGRRIWKHHEISYPDSDFKLMMSYSLLGIGMPYAPTHHINGYSIQKYFGMLGLWFPFENRMDIWENAKNEIILPTTDWLEHEHPELFNSPLLAPAYPVQREDLPHVTTRDITA